MREKEEGKGQGREGRVKGRYWKETGERHGRNWGGKQKGSPKKRRKQRYIPNFQVVGALVPTPSPIWDKFGMRNLNLF